MDRPGLLKNLTVMLETVTVEPIATVSDDTNLREELGLDSVDFMHLVMQIQGELDIELDPEELVPIKTVGNLLDLIESKLTGSKRAAGALIVNDCE
jgi:acyl carrier protein